MKKALSHMILFMALMMSVLSMTANGFAAANPGEFKPDDNHPGCRASHEGVLLAVIVPCIRETVADATQRFVTEFGQFVEPMMWSFATLVVTLMGVRVMTGEGDPKKQTFFLLLKIGAVAMMLRGFGEAEGLGSDIVFDAIQEGSEIVTSTLGDTLDQMQCNRERFQGEEPWRSIDCIGGDIFGYAPDALVSTSVFGMISSAMVSGSFGMMLTMGGVSVVAFIIKLIWRALYTYLMALIVAGFLVVISPVLIPLVFMSATFQYFEHWLKSLMSTMVQPLIVLAYLTLSFAVLDQVLYDPQHGVLNILSPEQIEKGYQSGQKTGRGSLQTNDYGWWDAFNINPNEFCQDNQSQQVLGAHHCLQKRFNFGQRYDFDMGADHEEVANKAIVSMLVATLVAYLLAEMLEHLMTIAQSMLGGGIALAKAVDGQAKRDQEAMKSIQQGLQKDWPANAQKKMEQSGLAGSEMYLRGLADGVFGRLHGRG